MSSLFSLKRDPVLQSDILLAEKVKFSENIMRNVVIHDNDCPLVDKISSRKSFP